MPELPEVETVKNGLSPHIIGQAIQHAHINRRKMRIEAPIDSQILLEGYSVTGIERRSKYLYIYLSSHNCLIIHLGMSGNLTMLPLKAPHRKHDHLVLDFNHLSLHFNDARRFGFYDIQKTAQLPLLPYIKNLGIEPLTDEFTVNYLSELIKNSKRPIKTLLMDSHLIVGIGNIYASESLFSTNISPLRLARDIDKSSVTKLHQSIVTILNEAILSGGASLKDHKQADGTLGYFQHNFKVYGRENEPCKICETPILKIIQSARSTFYCPHCQP
ncbi:MAG: formamidopyrimidine-DNA glycosylase [Alphaproteobacteria bacterium]|jgi:formamidopyrimidine-DNA glycosylase